MTCRQCLPGWAAPAPADTNGVAAMVVAAGASPTMATLTTITARWVNLTMTHSLPRLDQQEMYRPRAELPQIPVRKPQRAYAPSALVMTLDPRHIIPLTILARLSRNRQPTDLNKSS